MRELFALRLGISPFLKDGAKSEEGSPCSPKAKAKALNIKKWILKMQSQ